MDVNKKDAIAGGLFSAFGIYFLVQAIRTLEIGSAFRMGPGYFPLLIGGILIVLGIAIAAKAFRNADTAFGNVPWRGIVAISASIVLFAVTLRGLGFMPATALMVFVAALASPRVTLAYAGGLAVALTVFCTLIFIEGLALPLPLVGPWLSF